MKINSIQNNTVKYIKQNGLKAAPQKAFLGQYGQNFNGKKDTQNIKHDPENPIRKSMEQLDVFKATLITGLGVGARAMYYAFEDTDLLETTLNAGQRLAKRNYKNAKGWKLAALGIASWAAIAVGVVGAIAAVYAIYNAPKSMYQGEINAHKKSEQMDVYLAQNRIEKDLYTEVQKKAQAANTEEELEKVRAQYATLRMAKNQAPAFAMFSAPNP